jgi:Glycosyltransferase family 87
MRVWLAAALVSLAAAPAAWGATPSLPPPNLTEERAVEILLAEDGVRAWVSRYPQESLVTEGTYDEQYRDWTVKAWSGAAGQIVLGRVDDLTGLVEEAWTGPQVAWPMARGHEGAFGGKRLNSLPVWLAFCAVFVLGLADLRRLRSLRNLDLLVLVSLTVSLWYFNDGRVFTSVPLVYPVLLYLLGRMLWTGATGRATSASRPVWPVWLLAAATVFFAGFRIGLDVADSHVIDVGYSGVIGAHRIASGQAPYGHFPTESGPPCGPPDRNGRTVLRIQDNGRCEGQNEHGDTYGPVTYEAYLPGYALFGWKGKGDPLHAASFTAVVFDFLCILGLVLVGLRYGDRRLAATLAFAWASFPFTQYVASSSSNDAIQPVLLIFGFWLASSPWGRGSLAALASCTKFAPIVVAPLWATYPERRPRSTVLFAVAFVLATLAAFWVLLLEPDPLGAVLTVWDRTIGHQLGRESPFSLWDWRQYHAGLPDLHVVQWVLEALLLAGAVVLAFVPRRKTPLQLAALTAALLIGFEIVLTHWFYLYVVWFFPFVAFALLAPGTSEGGSRRPRRRVEGPSSPCSR